MFPAIMAFGRMGLTGADRVGDPLQGGLCALQNGGARLVVLDDVDRPLAAEFEEACLELCCVQDRDLEIDLTAVRSMCCEAIRVLFTVRAYARLLDQALRIRLSDELKKAFASMSAAGNRPE